MREAAAAALSQLLQQGQGVGASGSSKDEAWQDGDDDLDFDSVEEGYAPTATASNVIDACDAAQASAEASLLLEAYVDWVNERAPRSRKHADPAGMAPTPSMKRRLRRQRHRSK